MIIERKSTVTGSIIPEILEVLSAEFPITDLYNRDLKLRQPLGIYNVSLMTVLASFENVLDEVEKFLLNKPFAKYEDLPDEWREGFHEPKLLVNQRTLLYSLMEHMEDCFNILKCFVPLPSPDPLKRTKKAYCKHPEINDCVTAVAPYYDHVSNIVNHSKHNQGRIKTFTISTDTMLMPGYFIESCEHIKDPVTGIITWEVLGPSSIIHTPNRDTAFSFARDLRFHFVNIYLVSMHLAVAVNKLAGSKASPRIIDHSKMASQLLSVARRIEKLPNYFFRDEVLMPVPTVKIIETATTTELRLAYPDPIALLPSLDRGKKYMAFVSYRGDAVSVSIHLPYML